MSVLINMLYATLGMGVAELRGRRSRSKEIVITPATAIVRLLRAVSLFDRAPFLRPDLQNCTGRRAAGQDWPQATAEGGAQRSLV